MGHDLMTTETTPGPVPPEALADRPVRLAVIGTGGMGGIHALGLADDPDVELRWMVDLDLPRAQHLAEAPGARATESMDEALADPGVDAVLIALPTSLHRMATEAAARAGKHVFCEKPFSTSGADADRAIAAVQQAGLVLGIGHERRFEPAVMELQRRVREGDLGTPLVFEGNFSQDKFLALPPDNWRLSATEAPVGPLSATGIHLVDLAISLFGKPAEVRAHLATRATSFANGDTLVITLTFPGGEIATVTAVLTTPFLGRVCVLGSQGWMEIRDRRHPEDPQGWDVATKHRGQDEPEARFFPPAPAVRRNLEAFADAVSGGPAYPVTPEEIAANVRTFEAVTRFALEDRPVRLD